jgi:hypothetical protein
MGFEFATSCPVVGLVVMVDVTEKQAGIGAMNNEAEIEVDAG